MKEDIDDLLDVENEDLELGNQDLEQINVNIWFNKLENRLEYCLTKENAKEGFAQYRMIVKHIELLAIASGKIKQEEYERKVEEIKKITIDKYEEEGIAGMREAMIKYRIILEELLRTKNARFSLTYKN